LRLASSIWLRIASTFSGAIVIGSRSSRWIACALGTGLVVIAPLRPAR
jgi:hypothetical protein